MPGPDSQEASAFLLAMVEKMMENSMTPRRVLQHVLPLRHVLLVAVVGSLDAEVASVGHVFLLPSSAAPAITALAMLIIGNVFMVTIVGIVVAIVILGVIP